MSHDSHHSHRPHLRGAGARGVTLLEILAALALAALAMALAAPAAGARLPAWRLRAAARQVENTMQWARNAAALRGRPVRVFYDPEAALTWVMDREEVFIEQALPSGVSLAQVDFGWGRMIVRETAVAQAYPDGTVDAHTVALEAAGRRGLVAFERLTGEADYAEEEAP